jgi:hypothetical protein
MTADTLALPGLIYIAGYGRSGSTLLDVLFGNHPSMFGAGELAALFVEWQQSRCCSCGERYLECVFWGAVLRGLQAAMPGLTPQVGEAITRQFEAAGRRGAALPQAYRELWRQALAAMRRRSGKEMVVDSSKNSLLSIRRIAALTDIAGCDLRVIHLVRDPRAAMWSALRSGDRNVDMGHQQRARAGGFARALFVWSLSNLSVHLTAASHPRLPFLRLRYEDLVTQPISELARLGVFLGIDLAPVSAAIAQGQPFDPGHGVKGNRMRRRGPVSLRLDEEWKTALPASARWLAPLVWPLAGRYGYHVKT